MTQETDFFDNAGGGSGAPTASLKQVGDYVTGEIVDMFKRDFIPFGKKDPELREDGSKKQQLVIILQTPFTGWAGCTKVPLVDPNDESKGYKTPDQDDGKRALYVPEGKNIQFAIGRAASAAKVRLSTGGQLSVRITNLKPTDFGNELKEHEAIYAPPTPGSDFLGQAPAAPAAPAQSAAPSAPPAPAAPPAQQAPAAPAAPAQPAAPAAPPAAPAQPTPAPQGDPWATQGAPATPGDPWATPAPAGEVKAPPF